MIRNSKNGPIIALALLIFCLPWAILSCGGNAPRGPTPEKLEILSKPKHWELEDEWTTPGHYYCVWKHKTTGVRFIGSSRQSLAILPSAQPSAETSVVIDETARGTSVAHLTVKTPSRGLLRVETPERTFDVIVTPEDAVLVPQEHSPGK